MTVKNRSSAHALSVAVKAARCAGEILLKSWGRLRKKNIHRKEGMDWVTDVDRAAEKAILRIISTEFPDHTFKAEESAPTAAAHPMQWLIDPLDGTANYIHGFPLFCVSIALLRRGVLEVGVIFDPLREELFTAERSKGAYLNGRPISVSPHAALADSMISTGFPFRAKHTLPVYLESFRRMFLKTGLIRRGGSAAIDLASTACGRFEGFWEMALSPWDMAAGILLIQEAGGVATDFFGGDHYLEKGHVVAGNPGVHKEMVRILTPLFRGKIS